MEIVENRKMLYMMQNTPLNQKYHNYEVGDTFKTSARHNPKRISFIKAHFKLKKSAQDKKILFRESLHEKIRKSIDKNLPSRQSAIVVFENMDQCKALAKKWARFNIKPLKIYEVALTGKLHKCSCVSDEIKDKYSKEEHVKGITTYWEGKEQTGLYEWLFEGNVKVEKIVE